MESTVYIVLMAYTGVKLIVKKADRAVGLIAYCMSRDGMRNHAQLRAPGNWEQSFPLARRLAHVAAFLGQGQSSPGRTLD
jgi:hypothetical protein